MPGRGRKFRAAREAAPSGQSLRPDQATVKVTLTNRLGLHMRPAGEVVKIANSFPCDITLEAHGAEENAKNVIGLIALEAHCGDEVVIRAKGARAAEAVVELRELLASLPEFDEKEIAEYRKAAGGEGVAGRSDERGPGRAVSRKAGGRGKGRSGKGR